ncbi:MAG: hypothetical protein Q4Q03_04125, partial [Bowdeniella nasicola]|nr:hypothetical protein [Bowdeniella nasicola]
MTPTPIEPRVQNQKNDVGLVVTGGVFTNAPLQNQRHIGSIKVKLNTPIEQIRAETGRDYFVVDARWQSNPTEEGGAVTIDDKSLATNTWIDFSDDGDVESVGGSGTSWLIAPSSHQLRYGYEMPIMTTTKKLGEPVAGSSVLRVVNVEPVSSVSTYLIVPSNDREGRKDYQFHIQLQPEVVQALTGPVVLWQTGVQQNLGHAGVGGPPVEIAKSDFTADGEVTITTDTTKQGQAGYVVVADVTSYINQLSGGVFSPATVFDLPLDEDQLIPDRSDPNYFKQLRISSWFTDAKDRHIIYSDVNSYFNMHISDSPQVTNLSVGAPAGEDEVLTDAEHVNKVRATQNFIQGTANPNAEVTVMKVTGLDTADEQRVVLGQATANDAGAWETKLCKSEIQYNEKGEETGINECATKSFVE